MRKAVILDEIGRDFEEVVIGEEHGLCYGKESTSTRRSRMNLKPTNTYTKPNTNPKTQITCP